MIRYLKKGNSNMITVIIIDDHPLVHNGFEFILHNLSGIKIMGTFTNAAEAIGYLKENRIDVVLADINMPEMNGIDATLSIKKIQPSAQVIAISNIGEGSIVQRMLDAGTKGYLLKNVSARELLNSIHSVMSNTSAISPELEDILKKTDSSVPRITQREHEVLRLLTREDNSPNSRTDVYQSANGGKPSQESPA